MRLDTPERITNTHVYFWGSIFSNWYPSTFEYNGIVFLNSEAALMYAKAMIFDDNYHANKILNTENHDPRIVKKLGRKVIGYDDTVWSEQRYTIMVNILKAKFAQNPDMLDILLSYKNKTIVEGSPYDGVWGVKLHWSDDSILNDTNWNGDNLLGLALMEVRDDYLLHDGMEKLT